MNDKIITVFNRYHSKQLGTYTWYPHLVRNCYFKADKGANIVKTGLENADSAKLHIPYELTDNRVIIQGMTYYKPLEWEKQPNDSYVENITFTEGQDFFVVGDFSGDPINDKDYREGFYQYMNKHFDDVYKITTVGRYELIPHFEIGGA